MTRPKNIQISYELFLGMIDYIADHSDCADYRYNDILTAVKDKLDAMARRELYTAYKTGATKEIRAKAKEQYLNLVGILSSYRWHNEHDVNVKYTGDERRWGLP